MIRKLGHASSIRWAFLRNAPRGVHSVINEGLAWKERNQGGRDKSWVGLKGWDKKIASALYLAIENKKLEKKAGRENHEGSGGFFYPPPRIS